MGIFIATLSLPKEPALPALSRVEGSLPKGKQSRSPRRSSCVYVLVDCFIGLWPPHYDALHSKLSISLSQRICAKGGCLRASKKIAYFTNSISR
jgi:hypothetical protein